MHKFKFLLAALLLCAGSAHAKLVADVDYQAVAQPQAVDDATKVEVVEFFWYGCPHCYHLEGKLNAWRAKLPKNVVFKRTPVIWSPGHEKHAQIYYTLEAMNLTNQLHDRVFDAVQGQGSTTERVELRDENTLVEWIAKQGVDKAKFLAAYKSFGVLSQVQRAKQLATAYQVSGVPAFYVQGKYTTSPSLVKNEDRVFSVLNELIAQEQPKKTTAPTAKPAVKTAAKPVKK